MPTAVALAVWPDGVPIPVLLSFDGVYLATDYVEGKRPTAWLRLATPRGAQSRDIAAAVTGYEGCVAWSDEAGISTCTLTHGTSDQPSHPVGEPRLLVSVDGGVRYPLAALTMPDGNTDVLWSADRRVILRSTDRPRPLTATEAAPTALPEAFTGAQRLRALAVAAESTRAGRLAALTDRGDLFTSEWDLAFGPGAWTAIDVPAAGIRVLCIAVVGDAATLIGATPRGDLLATRVGEGITGAWYPVQRPDGLSAGPVRSIAAAENCGTAWFAAVCDGATWLARLISRNGRLEFSTATDLGLARR